MLQLVCFLVREAHLSLVGNDHLLQSSLHVLLRQILIRLALNELPAPRWTTWQDREVIGTAVHLQPLLQVQLGATTSLLNLHHHKTSPIKTVE